MITNLVNADDRNLIPHGATTVIVTLGDYYIKQSFLVVERLSTPVILACNYLTTNKFILNFKLGTFDRAENLQLLPVEFLSCHLITMDDDCPQAIPTKCKDHTSTVEDIPSDVYSIV